MAKWQKGQSGNPDGPRKGVERRAREAIAGRTYTAADGITYHGDAIALQVLMDIATTVEGVKPRDRVSAAQAILDRTFGKPTQPIEHDGELKVNQTVVKLPADLTDEEVEVVSKLDKGLLDADTDH